MFSDRTNWKLVPNRFSEAQREFLAAGREWLDLTLSNPTRAGLDFDAPALLAAFAGRHMLDYDPDPRGLKSARDAVAAYYREQASAVVAADSLILTTSTSEGYSYVFRLLCNPGDEVLVAKPSYPLFEFLADLQDVNLVPYPLLYDHGWQIDFATLEAALTPRTRAIVLVNPNNPTGSYVKADERAALNRLCRDHKIALIADEVFLDYAHDRARRPTFAENRDALTFTLSGVSKISGLPQMKLAWVAVSGPAEETASALERLEVVADTFLSMNTPIQLAAPVLLDQRKEIQPQLMKRVCANLAELDRQLAAQKICERLHIEGGWYAVLRVPVTRTDEDLAVELLQRESVLVHPGHFYDFPADGFLIASLITPLEIFSEGCRRLLGLLNS